MADQTSLARAGRGLSVLVVEDEFLIAMDLEMMLEKNGYRVIGPATSNEEAMRLLDSTTPDVGILDGNIRGQLVTPVAEELLRRQIPFVLTSAYSSFDFDGCEALECAPNAGKPTNERRLLSALAEAISG